jgi:putative copper export protein/methionine-rich copper-binding protein CopC
MMITGRSAVDVVGMMAAVVVGRLPVAIALALTFGVTSDLHAHLALQTSAPSADETLMLAPAVIRLSFTEPVELGLCTIVLTGPDGAPIATGPLETTDSKDVITAAISGPLVAGSYTVTWQAVGRDAHPVRGEFTFFIAEGAEGLTVPVEETPVVSAPPEPSPPPQLPTFGPQSPLYAGVRWIGYLGIFGVLGSLGFALLLSSPRVAAVPESFRIAAARGAAGLGILSALLLALSLPLRLQAQSHALFGAGITGERFSLIADTGWGIAWLLQAATALIVLAGFFLARWGSRIGWIVAAFGALVLVATPAMSGHAASRESFRLAAIASDAFHILGVGVWLGTLLALILVGIPFVRREPEGRRGAVLQPLVNGFSPIALVAAGVVFATGLVAAILHLSALPDLWSTGYGRLLSAKLLLVVLVMALGALNWRRIGRRTAEMGGDSRLLKSAGAELVGATLIIGLTAVLVAVPPPGDAPVITQTSPDTEATAQP